MIIKRERDTCKAVSESPVTLELGKATEGFAAEVDISGGIVVIG